MQLESKPGLRTTEFWLVLLSNLLINIGAIDVGGSKIRGAFALASTFGYIISRGLAKQGVPAAVDPDDDGPGDTDALPSVETTPGAAVPPDQGNAGHANQAEAA